VEPLKAELLRPRGSSQARGRMGPLASRASTSSSSGKSESGTIAGFSTIAKEKEFRCRNALLVDIQETPFMEHEAP